jgi:curli biogenesis system outer membrane secretion channel CsgG
MRWRSLCTLAAAAGLSATLVGALGAQDSRPGLAVLPFVNGGSYGQDPENYQALEVGIQQMLTTELAQNPALRVVDRSNIKNLMTEQDLGASGRVDAGTAARLGKLVGARYMVMGGFTDLYGNMRLDISVVSTETSEIVRAEKVTFKRDELFSGVVNAAKVITAGLKLPELAKESQAKRDERAREINKTQAVSYYTRGLLYADRGDTARAKELFTKALQEFPDYTEAQQALNQLGT